MVRCVLSGELAGVGLTFMSMMSDLMLMPRMLLASVIVIALFICQF